MHARFVAVPALTVLVLLSWAEWLHWRASTRRLGHSTDPAGREAVVILGFKNRGSSANYLNRYRVRAGLRSLNKAARESVLICCGGSVGSGTAEAELLRDYAVKRGYAGPIRLDRESTTTWQNVQNAIPLIEGFDVIKFASNSLHAETARAYLWKQRPDLAMHLARADEYRLGEITFTKPLAAVIGLIKLTASNARPIADRI